MNYDYQLVDDGGISQFEDVPFLIPIGATFECEYGKYKMVQHHKREDGSILPICDRIEEKQMNERRNEEMVFIKVFFKPPSKIHTSLSDQTYGQDSFL